MAVTFPLAVNHTQVFAFRRHLERPGLLWTNEHVAQGFAWSPGIACFGVPDHDGECLLELDTAATAASLAVDTSLWAIAVPFDTDETEVQVGTILDDRTFPLGPGRFRLVFEAHAPRTVSGTAYAYLLRFSFIPTEAAEFEILKQGPLESATVLSRTAERG